jgi:hypothetical protein
MSVESDCVVTADNIGRRKLSKTGLALIGLSGVYQYVG